MKNRIFLLFFFISLFLPSFASSSDSTWTVYKDGEFTTQCQLRFKASNHVVADVSDYLVGDFHDAPGHLFTWALRDLGLQDKKNNELIIIFKSSNNDEKTGITHGVFDIEVPNITTFKDIKVDAKVLKTKFNNGITKVTADIAYSTLLLDKAYCVLNIIPQKNNEQLFVTNVKIKFGWFFNIFITKKRYKSIVEWRVKKFTENMKTECELRQKAEK